MLDRISPETLRRLAQGVVRCHIPYEQLDECVISLAAIDDHRELGDLYLPWHLSSASGGAYRGPIERPSDSDWPIPLQVKAAPAKLHLFEDELRIASIARLAEQFTEHQYPQTFTIVASGLRSGERILLDGCHRACALWQTKTPFRVALFVIEPQDLSLFTDLARLQEYLQRSTR